MKPFQTIQMNLAKLGVIASNKNEYQHYPFNKQHLKITIFASLDLISDFIYAIHVADSLKEYMDSFFILVATGGVFISYTTITFGMTKLFDFLDKYEKAISQSESQRNSNETKKLLPFFKLCKIK